MKCRYLILTVFVAWACSTSPTGRRQLTLLPDSKIDSMGAQSFQQIRSKVPIDFDLENNRIVKCVANLITTANEDQLGRKNWDVVVFKSTDVNAFALPGSKIGVYSGLLKIAKTPAQLATVIGHEVGHVLARHGNERVSEALVAEGGLALADGALGNNKYKSLIMAGLGAGVEIGVLLPFSRAHESEADSIGLELMSKAGFDPREAIDLWKNMSSVEVSKPPQWLSTHPSDSARTEALRELLPKDFPIFNSSKYRDQASLCIAGNS